MDLDDFKVINDAYGHPIGDLALCTVGEQLLEHIREVDILCRFGGDEFAILLPATNAEGCQLVMRRLRSIPISNHDLPTPIGLSIGGATCPPGPHTATELLDRADADMYREKRRRKLLSSSKL